MVNFCTWSWRLSASFLSYITEPKTHRSYELRAERERESCKWAYSFKTHTVLVLGNRRMTLFNAFGMAHVFHAETLLCNTISKSKRPQEEVPPWASHRVTENNHLKGDFRLSRLFSCYSKQSLLFSCVGRAPSFWEAVPMLVTSSNTLHEAPPWQSKADVHLQVQYLKSELLL